MPQPCPPSQEQRQGGRQGHRASARASMAPECCQGTQARGAPIPAGLRDGFEGDLRAAGGSIPHLRGPSSAAEAWGHQVQGAEMNARGKAASGCPWAGVEQTGDGAPGTYGTRPAQSYTSQEPGNSVHEGRAATTPPRGKHRLLPPVASSARENTLAWLSSRPSLLSCTLGINHLSQLHLVL